MSVFFFYFGIILGLVFSTTIVSGVVWCVQITMSRGLLAGLAAGTGIALAQSIWSAFAAVMVFWLHRFSDSMDWLIRMFSAGVLIYMSTTVFGAERIKTLHYGGQLKGFGNVFRSTLGIAFAMPMRLPGFLALLIAMNFHVRQIQFSNALLIGAGVGIGSFVWWTYYVLLAALFGKRVPEPITVKSMNKLKVLAGSVLLALMFICLAPMVPGF